VDDVKCGLYEINKKDNWRPFFSRTHVLSFSFILIVSLKRFRLTAR